MDQIKIQLQNNQIVTGVKIGDLGYEEAFPYTHPTEGVMAATAPHGDVADGFGGEMWDIEDEGGFGTLDDVLGFLEDEDLEELAKMAHKNGRVPLDVVLAFTEGDFEVID